jgi:fructokinase
VSLSENKYPVVCYGEILWDVLPDRVVPGGAPMNVAFHLKNLGINPALITRIGHDQEGKKLIQLLEKKHISTDFFQMDFNAATGKVIALPGDAGEVRYDIMKPVAWDYIGWEEQYDALVSNASFFVFGSLAARSNTSRNTLYRLLEQATNKVLDLNLRPPHYTRQTVEVLLKDLSLLKLNLDELELITGWFTSHQNEANRIKILQDKFYIPQIIVTRGSEGAVLSLDGTLYQHPGFSVELADPIGSGDAFLAGYISKLYRGAGPPESLEFSSALGALIASYPGPCPDYHTKEIDELIRAGVTAKNH